MKAHIVGGGFAGLASAALFIRDIKTPGSDITIYEADDKLGGGFFLDGDAEHGYNLPGSIFDKEFRCALNLLKTITTQRYPKINVAEEFLTFNREHPFDDLTHIVDRNLGRVHNPLRYGLTLGDGLKLAKLSLASEASLDGKLIQDWFPQRFFDTEFWLLWSTLMGSLPQHTIIEFRRYLNRFVYLFPDLSTMANVFRSQFNQHEAFVEPLVAWLAKNGVNFEKGAFVSDLDFTNTSGRMTVNRLHVERANGAPTVAVAPDDIVLVTTGSQAADLRAGTMAKAPPAKPPHPGRSWALWKTLAAKHKGFGDPSVFFGDDKILDSRWVTFTVTTKGKEFLDEITNLTGSGTGSGGLLTLKDSPWVISLSIFEQPEILDQGCTFVWWGYGLHPERESALRHKPMNECSGEEILREILHHLKMANPTAERIVGTSICIPCDMPYVNNIWLKRKRGDRPPVVPEGMTNLGLLGQYVEVERDITFTFEYSTRTAFEAIRQLKGGPPPPPVYRGQYDPGGVWKATKVFLGLTKT
jgi:oleate hydratase